MGPIAKYLGGGCAPGPPSIDIPAQNESISSKHLQQSDVCSGKWSQDTVQNFAQIK